jgi:uncharacterized protein
MTRRFKSLVIVAIIAVMIASLLAIRLPAAQASVSGIVFSQIYAGGGAAASTWQYDYFELFNAGSSSVSVNGWSVQYQSSTGTTWAISATLPNVSIAPGKYLLVRTGSSGNGSVLPTTDVDGSGSVNLSNSAGKGALVSNGTALTCSSNATCFPNPNIVDLIGWGTLTNAVFEGANAAPTPTNATTALFRASNGCIDTDVNGSDIANAAANPRNSASPASVCGAGGTATPTNTATPTGSATVTITATSTATNTPGIGSCLPATARIRDIQGAAHISPRSGQTVTDVPGVVTAKRSNGFYIQEPDGCTDADVATSEGIFVFTSSSPTSVNVGNLVTVSGTVSEFRGTLCVGTDNLTISQIGGTPTITVVTASVALPTPVVIGTGGRVPPTQIIDNDATGNIETSGTFDATTDGIDFYESMEGMLVRVNNPVSVGPRNEFGEIPVLPDNGANATPGQRTARGGIYVTATDFNPEYVILDDGIGASTPNVHVGATFTGATDAVVDYSCAYYKLAVKTAPVVASNPLTREVTPLQGAGTKLTVATFNVENLSPNDPSTKFNALAAAIVTNLKSPDIITVEEVQDNNGSTNDTVVDATTTYNLLISAITTATGPTYQFRQINPVDDQDGGQPGGNIRVGFLYNPARVTFVDRGTCGSTTVTTVTNSGGSPLISCSPGRIDPANAAWSTSRKPLVGEFTFNGQTVFVIGNHFNSKGGDNPLYGRFQPPVRSSETQRHLQAAAVQNFVGQITAINPNANVIVLGDINDFQFSQTVTILKGTNLKNTFDLLPANEGYSYVFNGNSQVLDQILISNNLYDNRAPEFDVVHINAEFFDQISDHDPSVVRLELGTGGTGTPTATLTPTSSPTNTATNTATATATNSPMPPRPDTVGVYKDGTFYLRNTNNSGAADITAAFGGDPADLPVVGDWNGNGIDTIGVYRNSTGFFLLSDSNTAPAVNYTVLFGNPGDTPFAGRWTADMVGSGIGVYRNSNGILYQKKQLTTGVDDFFAIFGNPGDQGFAGDWEGNGFDSIGVYRSSNQTWYLSNNSTPSGVTFSDIDFVFDISTNRPVVGDWDGNGITTHGYLTPLGVFDLRPLFSAFAFGPADGRPVAGKWIAPSSPAKAGVVNPITGGYVNPPENGDAD